MSSLLSASGPVSVSRPVPVSRPSFSEQNVREVVGEGSAKRSGVHVRALERLANKAHAAKLLKAAGLKQAMSVSRCGYCPQRRDKPVLLVREGAGKAYFAGLQSCNSVWLCPKCSARISEERRGELNELLAWARSKGYAIFLLTLTGAHTAHMVLDVGLSRMKNAKKSFHQRKAFRDLPMIGNVSATEVTHGRNGWHSHFHVIVILEPGTGKDVLEALAGEWLSCLEKYGLTGDAERAFDVLAASTVGEYVAKFGVAEEVALSGKKRGRNGSRTPWQLLADSRDGDTHAGRLWTQYARAFVGRQQLVWSQGLRGLSGVGADDKQADDQKTDPLLEPEPPVVLRSWPGNSERWRRARRRLWALQVAAETGACLNAAEFGVCDAERWRQRRKA